MSKERHLEQKKEARVQSEDEKLNQAVKDIDRIAKNFGLDYFDTKFHPVSADAMYELAGYHLPGRFSHWSFGKDYYREKTKYNYNMQKYYELVLNTDPALAFFMENNTLIQNKLIIGHVLAHVDFFKNNAYFKGTERRMPDVAARFARDLNRYRYDYGESEVEEFLDQVISIEYCIDPDAENRPKKEEKKKKEDLKSRFADIFEIGETNEKKETEKKTGKKEIPDENERDLMLFIAKNSSFLSEWQKDIMLRMRKEMLYFIPNMKTHIMNEGWAAFWHKRILRELGELHKLEPGEDVAWMVLDSNVVRPGDRQINPYYVGLMILEDADRKFRGESRKDGKKDKDMWGDPIDYSSLSKDERENYNVFRIREQTLNDQEFLRNYLTGPLIDELILPYFKLEEKDFEDMDRTREVAKQMFINSMDNFGMPLVYIPKGGGNYNDNGELLISHAWDGRILDMDWAEKTLRNVRALWPKPVHLETRLNKDKKIILSCEQKDRDIKKKESSEPFQPLSL